MLLLFFVSICSILRIDTPEKLQQFKDGVSGNDTKTVHIEPTVAPNVLDEAKFFFNRTTNTEIRFRDVFDNIITIYPGLELVHSVFVNSTHLTQYLPTFYKSYNLTFPRSGTNNDDNLRDIFTFENAERLVLGIDFKGRTGFEKKIYGISHMKQLRDLSVHLRPKYSTLQLSAFLEIPPAVTTVRIIFPWSSDDDENTREMATNQCVPRLWSILSASNATIQFDKDGNTEDRPCWKLKEKTPLHF